MKGDVHDIGKNIVGVVLQCNNYEVIDLGVMVPSARILETARREQVDIIGLSGLITPSLEEMAFVAGEMEREGFTIPLLIGGATTSRVHTAVKIEPQYRGPTVHVIDASRAVGCRRQPAERELCARTTWPASRRSTRTSAPSEGAGRPRSGANPSPTPGENRLAIDWTATAPPEPCFTGVRALKDYPLEELVPLIDWTPFFQTWELAGHYPAILNDPVTGPGGTQPVPGCRASAGSHRDATAAPRPGRVGLLPGQQRRATTSSCTPTRVAAQRKAVIHTIRQQMVKPPGRPNLALADFVAPRETGVPDYVGAFAVTAGVGIEALVDRFEADHDDYNAILTKALADRLAEAFAELLHQRVRTEFWGYARDEALDNEGLIKERYQGIRPAPGYPACPDHTEKRTLFDLLGRRSSAGITLTESFAMLPTASVSGYYFWRPEAQYFGVGKIERDQVEDYARRKGMDVATVERWLAPNLNYDR